MQTIKTVIQKWGKAVGIGVFLGVAFLAGNFTSVAKSQHASQMEVLGTSVHATVSPTITPIPTNTQVTIINNIILPTQDLTPTPTPVISTPTPIVVIVMPTPTPTEAPQTAEIDINYGNLHSASTYTTTLTSGETAWQAVQNAVGLANITYTDYGGSLGIFITGFNGVVAGSNQYYDFQVNGTSSHVGVSSYVVQDHDILKFVLTSS